MEEKFKALLSDIFSEQFKPLKWKKQGNNFRFIGEDGWGKIINFQRSLWNTKDEIVFFINYGIYIEATNCLKNKAFKEYECAFRNRTHHNRGEYLLDKNTDINFLRAQVDEAIKEAMEVFELIDKKETFIEMIFNGELEKYSSIPVTSYSTCKVLCDMGYHKEVAVIIKNIDGEYFEQLKKEIAEKL